MRKQILVGLAVVGAAATISPAATVYNASGNTLPAAPFFRFDAGFPILGPVLGYNAPQQVSGGVYSMGPTDQAKYTFWATSDQVLDHNQTIEIKATVKLISQTSTNPTDRAGFAIALTDDRNYYNELYISESEIFLNQRSDTTRVRDTEYDMVTTDGFHEYTLLISGDDITVKVDGVTRLTGSMFDAAGLSGVPTLANWAVFGDITSSAAGSFELTRFSVDVVPEPGVGILGMGVLRLVMGRRGRRGRSASGVGAGN